MKPAYSFAAGVCLAACVTGSLAAQARRNAEPAQIVTGTYGACNPVVDDKLAGAEARSPSDCEVKFDADVRGAFNRAFAAVKTAFPAGTWTVRVPEVAPITHQARHTEKSPYRMDWSSANAYAITMQMTPANPLLADYQKQEHDALNSPHIDIAKMSDVMSKVEFETKAHIVAVINYPYGIADNFKAAERTPLTVPGDRYAFFAPHVQAPTGGDIGSSQPTAFVWLGRWTQPAIRDNGDGSEHIELHGAFDRTAPPLSVQNIQIRITAAKPIVDKILPSVDWAALEQLLPK